MKSSLRLALLACASFIGLALAAPALAAYTPSLTIEQSSYKVGGATTADVFIFAPQDDDPTAKLSIFSPAGYNAVLTQAPGAKIGAVLAIVKAKALGGALLPLAGDVLVANPADPAIQAAALRCTGVITNQANWVLNTQLQGQTVAIPVFVNKVGPLVKMDVCLPSPDIPPASGGATFGAQLVSADFTVKGVFTNAAARAGYEWAGIFTPYTPGTGTPNLAGTVEWRTYVGLPSSLTLAKVKAKKGLKFVGKLTVQGLTPTGVRLGLYAGRKAQPAPNAVSGGTGKRVTRTGKLPRTGKYTIVRPSVKFRTFFQMRFENYGTDCTGPSPTGQPVKCIGEDLAAVTSNQVRATKPARRR
jgi:hypothetical protein